MSDEKVLQTFMHISDLHFGSKIDGSGTNAKLPSFLSTFTFLDGLLGHHYKALSSLHQFYSDLYKTSSASLIVTGDITQFGEPSQFDLANSYLGAYCPNSPYEMGLGKPGWTSTSVPGNHDHWPGNGNIFGNPSVGLTRYLGNYPDTNVVTTLQNGISIRFIKINTDSEVGPHGLNRFLARGKFVDQLTQVTATLQNRPRKEIRVLLLHHSLSLSPQTPTKNEAFRPLEIVEECRRVLERFLIDNEIQIVLSGHSHIPSLSKRIVSNEVEEFEVFEARCGCTTQLDEYPYGTLTKISSERKLPRNTLIVHQVIEREDSLYWTSNIHWRSNSSTFVNRAPKKASMLPQHLYDEVLLS